MDKSALIQYLDFFLSNQDVVNGKPDPEMYDKAIRRLDLKPSECLIVEDNLNGIAAARTSGAHVLEVASVEEVNLQNIHAAIERFEGAQHA